ncbi:MAG: septum site-determining protein MinD [Bacillota bacterium]|nr:septum site-determining protein MinD [Bacillota bacterium]
MGEVIVITSGKGGVGKTTTSSNIGMGLANLGHKVCVVDADIGLRNLDVVMGLENRIVYDIVDVVKGNCKLKQALIKDKRNQDLYLLPAAQTKDKNALNEEEMIALCDTLRKDFDYVVIDCPAGIEQGFKNAIAGADRAIVVITPEVSAVRDADRIIGLLEASEIHEPKLIINRIRQEMVDTGDMLSIEDVKSILAIDLIGIVPNDEAIIISTNVGSPAVMENNSLAGQAFRNICLRITGQEIPFLDLSKGNTFFNKLKKLFK